MSRGSFGEFICLKYGGNGRLLTGLRLTYLTSTFVAVIRHACSALITFTDGRGGGRGRTGDRGGGG